MANAKERDGRGRYDYSNMTLLCVCGHTLGVHLAKQPRPCANGEGAPGGTGESCDCQKFRIVKAKVCFRSDCKRIPTEKLWICRGCGARCCEHKCLFKSGNQATCGKCQLKNSLSRR
jgi:hypothetical protein